MAFTTREISFDYGDLSAPHGSPQWAKAVHFEAIGALNDARSSRDRVEVWVKAIRETGAYQQMKDEAGRPFMFWEAYCTARQPIGLGYSPDEIDAILSERVSVAAINEKDAASQRPPGRPGKTVYDVHSSGRPSGNSTEGMLRRLRKDRPDLLARVLDGEMTPHAAMVEAGFRQKAARVPVTVWGVFDAEAAAEALCKHFTAMQLRAIATAISGCLNHHCIDGCEKCPSGES